MDIGDRSLKVAVFGLGLFVLSGATLALASDELDLEALKSTSWWSFVQKDIARQEYRITWQEDAVEGAFHAANRAQNLRCCFRDSGVEIVPRTGDACWCWGFELSAFGRDGDMRSVDLVEPVVNGGRAEYARPGLVEWYENGEEGIEQGFVIWERPAGEGAVVLEGWVYGDLDARLDDRGRHVSFMQGDKEVLRYGALSVVDADGRELAAGFVLEGEVLAVVIEDDGEYPLHVDPLLTSPSWTAEGDQSWDWFGFSVAGAGDVNGDGYSDVIVGAPQYSNGEVSQGRAYLYHGSASGLSTTPDWIAEGNESGSYLGISVASAGDVNNDVIVGAPHYDNGEYDEGAAFVYHGSSLGLSATADWTQEGNQVASRFGNSVACAGDVNGDGYCDVVIGAYRYDSGEGDEGRAYVYHGGPSGLENTPSWTAKGDQQSANYGLCVAGAGDVDNDGYADVLIGAPDYDNVETDEGRAYLYLGGSFGLSATAVWMTESDGDSARYGSRLASAGDVNQDGYGDVIVGAGCYSNDQHREGRVFIYYGGVFGPLTEPGWRAEGDQEEAIFGASVANAGDVNGDGYSDVIVGADRYDNDQVDEGGAFVYYGTGPGVPDTLAWTFEGDQEGALFGYSVADAGDVNGDGYGDVIVGAYMYDNGETDEGAAFVYYGRPCGLWAPADWTAEGDQAEAYFGRSVSGAGDVNNDGFSDVIVGAYLYDNGEIDEGRAYLYHGSPSGLSLVADWTAESDQAGAYFGLPVASAGDVNGDDYSDVIIGAHTYDNGETDEGAAFVYHGSPSGLSATASWSGDGDQESAYYGQAADGAGDVNGDGYSDVIVGAFKYDNGETNEGGAYLYHGSASGLSETEVWSAEGGQAGANFGVSVAGAGDVNGDGYSDVIVGEYRYDGGEVDEGRVHVYLGSAFGIPALPDWTVESNQAGAHYGCSVSSAGDVDNDGYSDVIVGAYLYDNGEVDEGRAFLYHGCSSGPYVEATWTAEIDQAGAYFGRSVSGAGDVNGDGCSDVIVGAYGYDNGQIDEGGAFVYHGACGLAGVPREPSRNYVNALFQNYPNPFRSFSGTTIRYTVSTPGLVKVRIFDAAGRLVEILEDRGKPGDNYIVWNGRAGDGHTLPTGIYFYQIRAEGFSAHKKMILVK